MCPADVFEEFISRRPSKSNESPWFENRKTNFADEHFELVFSFQVHMSFHSYPEFSQINSSLYLYLHVLVVVGCKLFMRHFHGVLSIKSNAF